VSTPGTGPQPPEQDPSQPGQGVGWGQQPPAGQPVPGQPAQSWGAPVGQPGQQPWGAPQGATGAQAFGQPEQPASRSRRWLPIVGGVLTLLVVLSLLNTFLGGTSAEVGDCVNDSADEVGVVDCDSGDAAFEVAGVVDDVSQNELANDMDVCGQWPNSVAYAWEGSDPDDGDSDGTGYCLEELTD